MRTEMRGILVAALIAGLGALGACGGGGGGSGGGSSGGGGGPGSPVANAGADINATKAKTVTLDGSGSSDPDGDSLTYSWRQTLGPDVTGGAGTLSGVSPSFSAPDNVESIVFELTVSDGSNLSAADTVVVNVLKNEDKAYFVDGDNGSNTTGDGTREKPFATIAHAISQVTGNDPQDIYVMARGGAQAYDETGTDLNVPAGTSLYGGYNANWIRDVKTNKSKVNANFRGVRFVNVNQDAWFSGFELMSANSPNAGSDVFGLFADGNAATSMFVHDNIIKNGDVAAGTADNPGDNYGLFLRDFKLAKANDNAITAGMAGRGAAGTTGAKGANGDRGDNGNRTGGRHAPGGSGTAGGNGGSGGARGGGLSGTGGGGAQGGTGTAPIPGITNIAGGPGGVGGVTQTSVAKGGTVGTTGGRGIPGAAGSGFGSLTSSNFVGVNGATGGRGGHGSGGGGGGGGAANSIGVVGGGGGGGGEGGEGGFGGDGGSSGGASIGVWLHNIGTTDLTANVIVAGNGGLGGTSGLGGDGGSGGKGGDGAAGDDQGILGAGGGGADGADGGNGGTGGRGGAGGGGPSYGVAYSAGMAPVLSGNTITSGAGGNGGNGGVTGNGGNGGYSFAVFDRNPNDAFSANLNQNVLNAGTAGSGGSSSGLDTSKPGAAGQAGERNFL